MTILGGWSLDSGTDSAIGSRRCGPGPLPSVAGAASHAWAGRAPRGKAAAAIRFARGNLPRISDGTGGLPTARGGSAGHFFKGRFSRRGERTGAGAQGRLPPDTLGGKRISEAFTGNLRSPAVAVCPGE